MGTQWSHEIDLAAEAISASRARDFVRRHLVEHGLSHLSDDVELVVSELSTNAVTHAATSFTVSLHAVQELLLVEVKDGSGVAPSLITSQVLGTNGRGMAIVNMLSHAWGTRLHSDGGKSVWVEFGLGDATEDVVVPLADGAPRAARRPTPICSVTGSTTDHSGGRGMRKLCR